MTIDFMVKIIVFDCYLTKRRLLYVWKTGAVAAGVVSPEQHRVRSRQTAPLAAVPARSVGAPPCCRSPESEHEAPRASLTFPMSPHASWQSVGWMSSVFPPSRCPRPWHSFSYLGHARTCLQRCQ